ncbi:eukaryotic translation initiation factor 3 subunit I-like isoform X2 [Cynoglossus semilaevis]|nr:eukaryotic translation initiation factor 3 subunit I-like isoform X2 [Cynoglossus semilaevis]XP_024915853.1 eukaryotic translation initiation factor 3 subunit I-like isoform X2 [Cynoglossus semilaevis]
MVHSTYNRHTGAVRCEDCDWDTKNVLTESAVDCGITRPNTLRSTAGTSTTQTSVDLTMYIGASMDNTAKVLMGGEQETMGVTTASTSIGKFEAGFFHAVYKEEFDRSQRSFWSHQLCGFPL